VVSLEAGLVVSLVSVPDELAVVVEAAEADFAVADESARVIACFVAVAGACFVEAAVFVLPG